MPNEPVAERIRILTERIDRLPAPGAVVIRLFEVTSSSTAGIDEVVSVLASDPSLASSILSLCRRCNHGLVQEVETLEHAVVLLGFDEIRSAALSIELCGLLGRDPESMIAVDLRRHAVITASIARTLALRLAECSGVEPSTAFLAGLLHDLGHLVLAAVIPDPMAELAESARIRNEGFDETLRRVIGVDGGMIGDRIAERWGFPASLRGLIARAGRGPAAIPETPTRRLELVVGLADAIASNHGLGAIGRRHGRNMIREFESALGLEFDGVEEHLAESLSIATRSADSLGLDREPLANHLFRRLGESSAEIDRVRSLERDPAGKSSSTACSRFLERVSQVTDRIEFDRAVLRSIREIDPDADVVIAREIDGDWIGALAATAPATPIVGDPGTWVREALAGRACVGGDRVRLLGSSTDGMLVGVDGRIDVDEGLVRAWHACHALFERGERSRRRAEREIAGNRAEIELARRTAVLDADASVAEIAAGAAHEMHDPLTVISGRTQLLLGRSGDPFVDEGIREIHAETLILADLVRGLHSHATGGRIATVAIGSDDLLERCANAAREVIGEAVSLESVPDSEPVGLCVDVRRITDLTVEAVRNACQAKEDVRIRLRSSIDGVDGRWSLLVEDDGPGFGRKSLEHAFDPFFSQRAAGRRPGLGLAVVRRIAEAHGGSASVHNGSEGGGCLVVTLPIEGTTIAAA